MNQIKRPNVIHFSVLFFAEADVSFCQYNYLTKESKSMEFKEHYIYLVVYLIYKCYKKYVKHLDNKIKNCGC